MTNNLLHFKSEDLVRDELRNLLGLANPANDLSGVGQQKTFNQLGIKDKSCSNLKPDGWFLPKNVNDVAIVCETKNSNESCEKNSSQIEKYINAALTKYNKVIGIIYNGIDVIIYKNNERIQTNNEVFPKEYYFKLFETNIIDKQKIYALSKKINDCLHIKFGIKNLYHRMVFTACALVATKEGAILAKGMDYNDFHNSILNQINKSLQEHRRKNEKLQLLADIYAQIQMNSPDNRSAIDDFIAWIKEISEYVTSDNWNGEDVMGIFFNEFNRYKAKSENGQIFTPDHITSFMYRLIHCNKDDRILDATCGSGAFLVKAMCNMIKEAGGVNTKKANEIKENQLFGIEWDKEIFALACANMLIHKDGKTNLEQLDTRGQAACDWIHSKNISKVLMNPPYERKYGCMQIVENVLNNVPAHTECAFILPDKKLEKDYTDKKYGNKLLKNHTLKKIIKLPENLFFGVGVTTSIFVFESGVPQNNKSIQGFYIEDDGLETVKNQGRQDIKNKWQEIEDKWIKIIENPVCKEAICNNIQSIEPTEHLSYQMPEKPFEIYEEDFIKTMMDYEMFKRGIDVKEFGNALLAKALYSSDITTDGETVNISLKTGNTDE